MNGLIQIIRDLIQNDRVATLLMSIIPLIELKGGIVFARGAGMGFFEALAFAYIGSTVAFFFVYWLLKPILKVLKKIKGIGKLAEKIESYFEGKAKETLDKQEGKNRKNRSEVFYKALGVFVFVAIPLPMTGVWTGTAIAVFLNLKFKDAILPVVLGNLVAGVLISLLAELCIAVWDLNSLNYILYGLLILVAVLLVITVIKVAKQKPAKKDGDQD